MHYNINYCNNSLASRDTDKTKKLYEQQNYIMTSSFPYTA